MSMRCQRQYKGLEFAEAIHELRMATGDPAMQHSQKSHRLAHAIPLVLAWFIVPLASAGIDETVEDCNGCHGADGASAESDVPTIGGVSPFVLEEYMLEFRDEARPCRESKYRNGDLERPATDMCAVAKALSEAEITELAEYYSGMEFVPAKQDFDAASAAEGSKIHRRDCEKCHSDGGSLAADDAGMLAGQWMDYLEQVFADYKAGDREMMEDKMKDKIDALDTASISALIHYYGSLQ
jgi:sulfide dehydrogenase cytochrome subunit